MAKVTPRCGSGEDPDDNGKGGGGGGGVVVVHPVRTHLMKKMMTPLLDLHTVEQLANTPN